MSWRGRPAWRVRGAELTIVVTRTGGHLAALWATDDAAETNPLWQPHWPTAAPSAAASSDAWGSGAHAVEAPLLTNIVGSNLCLDRFGGPRPGESRPLHGEAGVVEWSITGDTAPGGSPSITVAASLPLARLRVSRSFALLPGARLRLTTCAAAEGAGGGARSVEWCEHTTLGGVFLDGCDISAGVDTAHDMPADGAAPAERDAPAAVDVAAALRLPAPAAPPEGHVRTCRVVQGSWAASNAALGWRLAATWAPSDFPWLCLWTEHRLRTTAPWGGVERTRGMELSTKPFPEGAATPASRAETFLGTPTAASVPEGGEATRVVEFVWERMGA